MKLAIHGGTPIRSTPLPERGTLSKENFKDVTALLEEALTAQCMPGYGGPKEAEFCQYFCQMMGGGYADGVSSGSMAGMAALAGVGVEPFGDIIVPPMTDAGPVMACIFLGCVPVPADGETRSFNITAEGIAKRLTKRTRAIMIAHIPGEPAEMDAIMKLANAEGIPVVEDCSQAHGATYDGKPVGTFGKAAFFSTMFTKQLCTGGQGGVLYTTDHAVYERARLFANRGKPFDVPAQQQEDRMLAGVNASMDEISATLGLSQLRTLKEKVQRRQNLKEQLKEAIVDFKGVQLGWEPTKALSSPWFLRLRIDTERLGVTKDQFCEALTAEGYRASPHLPMMPTMQTWYKNRTTLGSSGFPWTSAEYDGPKTPDYPIPETIKAEHNHFRIGFHEKWSDDDMSLLACALHKVETACLKKEAKF
nr:DegT/DnrJ/EryC1/StrS family aminotransferase [uncultured Pseudodesulfovibrio sp.]